MTTISKGADLRGSADDELATKLREAKEELFNLRFQAATGQLDNSGRLRAVRKDIARIYTVLRERELGISSVEPTAAPSTGAGNTGAGNTGAGSTGAGNTGTQKTERQA